MNDWILGAWTTLGGTVLYVMNRLNGHQPFSLFTALNVNVDKDAKPIIVFLDVIVSSMLGALVVFTLTGPATAGQAVAAGLGMTGILSAAAKR